jgi:hypothetical protein
MRVTIRRITRLCVLATVSGLVAWGAYVIANSPKKIDPEQARARLKPSEETAKHALTAALRSWQKGEKAGKVAGLDNPSIYLVDTCRLPEQILERFTILGEAAGDGPRCLSVRVNLHNPDEEQRLRFVVMGIDPIWVYRYEDFEMTMHWECGREERESKGTLLKKSKD